ncbi:outer membrane beta-barrel protein [Nitrospira sp. Nam74]
MGDVMVVRVRLLAVIRLFTRSLPRCPHHRLHLTVALLGLWSLAPQLRPVEAEWYLGAYGGVTMPQDTGFRQLSGTVHTQFFSDFTFSNGAIGGLKFGNYFLAGGLFDDKWVGLEADVFYAHPSFQPQTMTGMNTVTGASVVATVPHTGLGMLGGTLNLVMRYPGTYLKPYIGGGVGGVHFSASETGFGPVNSTNILGSLMVGIQVTFTDHIGVLAEFKHLMSDFQFASGQHTSAFQAENIIGGLVWHF